MMVAPAPASASPGTGTSPGLGTEGLSSPEEYQTPGHVDEAGIDAIASHILG